MTEKGHQQRLPPPRLSGRCGFGEGTFAETRGNGEDAPKAVLAVNPRVLAARACVCQYDLKVGRSSKLITRPSLST
jgi:hypothetical protein